MYIDLSELLSLFLTLPILTLSAYVGLEGSSSSKMKKMHTRNLQHFKPIYLPPNDVIYVIFPALSGVGDFEGDLLCLKAV